ncbi:MAG TPA: tRNA (adenosine(37)-N6)-threonylcarbamoyltransferase complex ATPase subunit type 1 TsaE [Pyrinomonadaceae bacterium]|nr:tRNA (adenosine(37)-N6)-threonylcarbamoyltransferase complex ATPase subunit type 1 TsaE [Pyrinomonadaceae bacterium]
MIDFSKIEDQGSKIKTYICQTPQDTFDLGEKFGEILSGGEMILLKGGLGAGKTLFTKGVLYALRFDVDEVTSPSFTLVNLYRTEKFEVFHIDLWRIDEKFNAAEAVGLGEILEDETAVTIIEWSERLKDFDFPAKTFVIEISGDGDLPREISIKSLT